MNAKSTLMQDYFAQMDASHVSFLTPFTLRGFVVRRVIDTVAQRVLPAPLSPSNLRDTLYTLSVLSISNDQSVGAYSDIKCYSNLDTTCETNTGLASFTSTVSRT